MSPWLDLGLPATLVVKGGVPVSQSPEDLVADMVEIDLPDGTTLDIGWVPEHSPEGRYQVVVYRAHWSDRVDDPLFFADAATLVREVRAIVRRHS